MRTVRYTFDMTLDALVLLCGTLVALLPFLGFPVSYDNVILVVLGIVIIALGIVVRRRGLGYRSRAGKTNTSFVESAPLKEDVRA